MKDTIQIAIAVDDTAVKEQLIAQLSIIDFDAFEERESELIAFIESENFSKSVLEKILLPYKLPYGITIIKEQNWNELWESNFPPVVVGNFCAIRAHFHQPFMDKEHEILITPKMSFGTGHHATTYMMISEMSQLDFKNKQVADFGTGTGVLAILADKLGGDYVWAIDIDDWSIDNANENIEKNNCENVIIEKIDRFDPCKKFDIILANINKNVILDNVEGFLFGIKPFGQVLLSGLLKEDENDIISAFRSKGFSHKTTTEKNKWICLLLQYEEKFE